MTAKKRKILLISKNFPPTTGGMEQLAWNLYQWLSCEFDCDVIAPSGAEIYIDKSSSQVSTCPISPLPVFLICAYNKAKKLISSNHYDLCIGCSGLIAPILSQLKSKYSIPGIVLVHGLDLIAKHFIYQKLFVPAICRTDLVIANSKNTADLCLNKCEAAKVTVINPGVDIPSTDEASMPSFRQKFGLQDKVILLSVGRIIPRKGIAEFIQSCLPRLVDMNNNIVYCVVGEEPNRALTHASDTRAEIRKAIDENKLQNHVLLTGKLDEKMLNNAYAEANLFIFPVLNPPNDVEGFGMVSLEAAARGLATIAFKSGGVPDAVSPQSGILITKGDYEGMSRTILAFLNGHHNEITKQSCIVHAQRYTWESYATQMIHACKDLVDT